MQKESKTTLCGYLPDIQVYAPPALECKSRYMDNSTITGTVVHRCMAHSLHIIHNFEHIVYISQLVMIDTILSTVLHSK